MNEQIITEINIVKIKEKISKSTLYYRKHSEKSNKNKQINKLYKHNLHKQF